MLMGKKSRAIRYETIVQLLVLAIVALTSYLAINLMDLELFSVSKSMFITLWSSINPWLCPPYVYLLINFMIFIIFALSIIHSNTIFFNPSNDHDSFMESSLVSQNLVVGSTLLDDDCKFHTLDDTFKDCDHDDNMRVHTSTNKFKDHDHDHDDDMKVHTSTDTFKSGGQGFKDNEHGDSIKVHTLEDTFKDWDDDLKIHKLQDKFRRKSREVVPKSVVDKRELRKSKTFHEGGSIHRSRVERYVKILSQEELDRQVEAFIHKFRKK